MLCLALTVTITACEKQPPSSGTDEAPQNTLPENEVVVPEKPAPIMEVAPAPETPLPPLDLALPPDLEQDDSPLAWDEDPLRLPNLFDSPTKPSSRVSGKLLLHETQQEDALDNVSGAQVEVNIPVK